jgi:hypothetical protein
MTVFPLEEHFARGACGQRTGMGQVLAPLMSASGP